MTKDEALKLALKFVEDSECGTADLEAAIKEALAQPERDYERGFIDGMQKQMQSSVDKAVNRMAQPEQEPAAWWNDTGTHIDLNVSGRGIPLYTTPPQHTDRNQTLEEVAQHFDKMRMGDTSVSFAIFVRGLKR